MVNTYLAASAAVLSSSPSKKGIISESLSSVNEGIRASNLGRNVSLTWRYLGHIIRKCFSSSICCRSQCLQILCSRSALSLSLYIYIYIYVYIHVCFFMTIKRRYTQSFTLKFTEPEMTESAFCLLSLFCKGLFWCYCECTHRNIESFYRFERSITLIWVF